MADIIDSPMVKLKKQYEAQLKAKDEELDALKLKVNTVRGINELLKFEILNLEKTIANLGKSVLQATEHVKILKSNLPDDIDTLK